MKSSYTSPIIHAVYCPKVNEYVECKFTHLHNLDHFLTFHSTCLSVFTVDWPPIYTIKRCYRGLW